MQKSFLIFLIIVPLLSFAENFKTIQFPSEDGLTITADLYMTHKSNAPFIILFHRAGWSRGEYREIAPKLSALGFNCLAVDQRSGGEINGVINETAKRAKEKKKGMTYLDAVQDLKAAILYTKKNLAKGKIIIWGSSYSASLVLVIGSEFNKTIAGIVSFSPGEYFSKFGKSHTFVQQRAKKIKCPVFITSAKAEQNSWKKIYEAIPSSQKRYFLPVSGGVHGSETLWDSTKEHKQYWKAVKNFLGQFLIK